MTTRQTLIVNNHYLPEDEYQNLYLSMSMFTEYNFTASIYEEGVIIYILPSVSATRERNTINTFPNLLKLIRFSKRNDIDYIDLFQNGNSLNPKQEKEYDLKFFKWNQYE